MEEDTLMRIVVIMPELLAGRCAIAKEYGEECRWSASRRSAGGVVPRSAFRCLLGITDRCLQTIWSICTDDPNGICCNGPWR